MRVTARNIKYRHNIKLGVLREMFENQIIPEPTTRTSHNMVWVDCAEVEALYNAQNPFTGQVWGRRWSDVYCIQRTIKGNVIALNRDYLPLGMYDPKRRFVKHDNYPEAFIDDIALTYPAAPFRQDGCIYFYNDGTPHKERTRRHNLFMQWLKEAKS